MQTKDEEVQAFVRHVFINKHRFFPFNATTKKLNKIPVLEFGNQFNFILELVQSLTRTS